MNKYFIYILSFSIVFCLFRLPVFALLNLRSYAYLANFPPFIILTLKCLLNLKDHFRNFLRLEKYIIWLLLVSIFYIIIFFIGPTPKDTIRELSSTTLFLIFPVMLILDSHKNDPAKLLEIILPTIVILAFTLTATEFLLIKLKILSAKDVHFWLTKTPYEPALRITTFMGQGAISGLVCLAFSVLLFFELLLEFHLKIKSKKMKQLLFVLSTITLFLCDSLTLVFIMIVVFIINILIMSKMFKIKILDFRKQIFQYGLLVFLGLVTIFYISGLGERSASYFFEGQIIPVFSYYFPKIQGCSKSFLFFGGFPISKGHPSNKSCNIGEFHGLLFMFKYGLMLQIGWFSLLFFPILKFMFTKDKQTILAKGLFWSLIIFPMTFLHYSGAEVWGNNYILSLFVVLFLGNHVSNDKRLVLLGDR